MSPNTTDIWSQVNQKDRKQKY